MERTDGGWRRLMADLRLIQRACEERYSTITMSKRGRMG
jgi:hypothetical protein